MDKAILAALIGAFATVVAALIARPWSKARQERLPSFRPSETLSQPGPSPRNDKAATSQARVLGQIQVELVFVRNQDSGSGVVPAEVYNEHMADRARHGVKTTWWYDTDPHTGEKRPAYTPIEGGRLALIESRGIRHGDRYIATFDVKEVTRQGKKRKEMWLVDAQPVHSSVGGRASGA